MDEHAVQPFHALCTLGAVHNAYKNIVHLGGGGICELLVCLLCLSVFHHSIYSRLHLSESSLSGSPIIRFGLALRVDLLRIL
jgi:hypothetical protein